MNNEIKLLSNNLFFRNTNKFVGYLAKLLYFSIVDVIIVLTESNDLAAY